MSGNFEKIFPEKKLVKFKNEEIEIKDLSIKGSIDLVRFVSKNLFAVLHSIKNNTLKDMKLEDLIDLITTSLNENEMVELLEIITGKDKKWIVENFKLSAALKLIRMVLENEDIGEVFTQSLQMIKPMRMLLKTSL